MYEGPTSSVSSPAAYIVSVFVFYFSHSSRYFIVIFICTFLIPNDDVCGLFLILLWEINGYTILVCSCLLLSLSGFGISNDSFIKWI